ncbi:MAG: VanZ family protein [Pseudomonadales bacterium]
MSERLLALAFWLALAFASYSAFAPPSLVAAPSVSDIVLHALAFFVLTLLLQMAYLRRRAGLAAGLMLAYGAAIELIQMGLPERSAELKDLLVDLGGIGLGLLAYRLVGARLLRLLGIRLS